MAEAERRGLPNIKSMVEAIPELLTDKSVQLFEKFGVFTRAELESRVEVKYENYSKTMNIEAKTMIDMGGETVYSRCDPLYESPGGFHRGHPGCRY